MEAARIEPSSCEAGRRLETKWPGDVLALIQPAYRNSGRRQLPCFQERNSEVAYGAEPRHIAEFSRGFSFWLRFLRCLLFRKGSLEQEQPE